MAMTIVQLEGVPAAGNQELPSENEGIKVHDRGAR